MDAVTSHTSKKAALTNLLLLGGLLFLRFPFLIATTFVPDNIFRGWVFVIFGGGTYLLTAILIWREREHLRDFWIDLAAAITFLLQFFCFPIGIGLFWKMRRQQVKFPRPPAGVWRWMLAGAILAIGATLVINWLGFDPPSQRGEQAAGLAFLIPAIFIQMTNAAIWEEPLFRGFLWGYLRRARWQNIWIWLFQAGLFTLGHVYYLRDEAFGPWLIRMLIPALLLGWIAWQARSIFASMVTHGVFNAYGNMLLHSRSLPEAISVGWVVMTILALLWIGVWGLQIFLRRRGGGMLAPVDGGG